MKISFVKELDTYGATMGGDACLVVDEKGQHYIVSHLVSAFDHRGPETLAFPSTSDGVVVSWKEVAGGRGVSREETIKQLETL